MAVQITNALAAIAVRDLAESARWYTLLFGVEPTAQPMDGLQEWQFPDGGWLQVYENAEHAGHGAVTLVVTDISACRTNLANLGYSEVRSVDSPSASLAILLDPDGNQVVFAQSNDPITNPSVHGAA